MHELNPSEMKGNLSLITTQVKVMNERIQTSDERKVYKNRKCEEKSRTHTRGTIHQQD